MKQLKITLVRGFGGKPETQRKIARALGLYRKEHSVIRNDDPITRGMIAKIPHLLKVEPCNAAEAEIAAIEAKELSGREEE